MSKGRTEGKWCKREKEDDERVTEKEWRRRELQVFVHLCVSMTQTLTYVSHLYSQVNQMCVCVCV